ncbi:MAG: EFR1 family ferrodoxin [Nitrospinota bacterium]|nr:EFR1 family ferrodoxin [Nitrospinota bacterium]
MEHPKDPAPAPDMPPGYTQVTIYYATGTGNTFRAANWMKELAEGSGATARLVAIHQKPQIQPPEDSPGHLAGFMAPAHGFITMWPMLMFAIRTPRVRQCSAFVIHTRAGVKFGRLFVPGLEGVGNYLMALILWLKGYSIRGVMGLDMPSNWMSLHPGLKPANAEAIINRGRRKTEVFAGRILNMRRAFWSPWAFLAGIPLLPVSIAYLFMGRFFLAKLFFASYRCDNCYLCVNLCPNGAVIKAGPGQRPYWTFECESCMRCMAYCPKEAIEAGHSIGLIMGYVTAIPAGAYLLGALTRRLPWLAGRQVEAAEFFINYLFALGAMFLLYRLFHRLMDNWFFNRLFTYTTLTRIYRRYHEPDSRLGALLKAERPRPMKDT